MNRVILVTAIGGDVGHSIIKCLHNRGDRLIGCDMQPFPVGMDMVEVTFQSYSAKHENYCTDLLEKCIQYKVTHLIPVSEPEIEVISSHRKLFEEIGVKLCINNSNIIDVCLDKYSTAENLRKIGLTVPEYYNVDDFRSNEKLHIVKYRKSCGSKFLKVFSTQNEFNKIIESAKEDVIIQEYIDESDSEYTVGVFSDGTDIRVISFKRKLQNGFTKFVELKNDESIIKDAEVIAKHFHLVGSINIQLRRRQGINYIFEINPRLSGTVHFRHILGFEDAVWWLDVIDGIKLPPYECKYNAAIGIREMNEKFLVLE